jgi:hypothetical protein
VGFLVAIIVVVLVGLVILLVGAPLRAAREAETARESEPDNATQPARTGTPPADPERDELDAAREAKYREIRDAELDYRTGKLSHEDYETIDSELRAEAIEILNRMERIRRP